MASECRFPVLWALLTELTIAVECGGTWSASDGGTGGAATDTGAASSADVPITGGSSDGGTPVDTDGGSFTGDLGAPTTTDGGSSTGNDAGIITRADPPPAPPTASISEPSAIVAAPNLRVLPWAGFKSAVSYTFDDSQPSQMEHLPELKATGVPMTFFVNPSASVMSGYDTKWSDIATAGSEIANHTWSHCHSDLSDCPQGDTQVWEITAATNYIISHLGVKAVYSFTAPFGDTGWNSYAEPYFLAARGVEGGMVPGSGVTDWYNLPCFGVVASHTAMDFNASIDSARSGGNWDIFMFHSILPTSENWEDGVDISEITTSLAYAKSLGDVWLDTFGAVAAYARGQQMFEQLAPTGNTWTWTLPAHMPPGKVLRVTVDGGSLSQGGTKLAWNSHGYYEISLDAGNLTWTK